MKMLNKKNIIIIKLKYIIKKYIKIKTTIESKVTT